MKDELIKVYNSNKMFIHYCCISFFCTIIMYALFISINYFSNGMYLLAEIVSYVASFATLFILDRKLFKAKPQRNRDKIKQANNFIIFRGIGLVIDAILLTIFIEKFGIPNVFSKVLSSCITFSYNYFTNKIFVFKNRKL